MLLSDTVLLWTLGGLILLLLLVLAFVLRIAARGEPETPAAGAAGAAGTAAAARAAPRMRAESLRSSFRQAVELIESHLASRKERYGVPWMLVFDDGGDGRGLGLAQAGIASTLGTEAAAAAATPGLAWHFFDQGVALELDGRSLGEAPSGAEGAEPVFEELLGLCHEYRPERPLDGVVLTVPAALLLGDEAQARAEVTRLAQRAGRRLWRAQNRFGLRLAVHVVVSGCEQVPGFAAFARSLPELLRGSMLGWASPFDATVSYQPEWVQQAVDAAVATLDEAVAESFAEKSADAPQAEAEAFFLLPARVAGMRGLLQRYLDELMRPSAYHEPFLLRGVYFSGDAGEAAALAAPAQPGVEPGRIEPGWAPAAGEDAVGGAAGGASATAASWERRPAFLRDVFEAKVFPEQGLTAPLGQRQAPQPTLGRGLRLGVTALLGGWGVGLVCAAVVLQGQVGEWRLALQALDAPAAAEVPGDGAQRARALVLLRRLGAVEGERLWSFFMPGSWPVLEVLPERLQRRLDAGFADVVLEALRRGLNERAATITGVARDASTGELIVGAPCAQAAVDAAAAPVLAPDGGPAFAALSELAEAAQRLELARAALQRLQLPPDAPGASDDAAASADLALLLREALGTEPPLLPARSAALFRSRGGVARPAPVPTALLAAFDCRLRVLAGQWLEQQFEHNPLLQGQRDLAALLGRLREGEPARQPAAALAQWRELMALIKAQEQLLGSGPTDWTQRSAFQGGAGWERLLARVGATPLLGGPAGAAALRERADRAQARLASSLGELVSAEGPTALAWNAKEARLMPGAELQALREALAALLGQPFAMVHTPRELAEGPGNAWDAERLDQALAVSDQRKRAQAELLPRFPQSVRAPVEALVQRLLALAVAEQAAEAQLPASALPGADVEGTLKRLQRVQQLLAELGGRDEAEALRRVVARDAVRRLQALEGALQRAELYAPRQQGLAEWDGTRAPALAAFGVGDAAQLGAYLAQQHARAEALGKEAELWLAVLGDADGHGAVAQRWQALLRELERYRLKNPNSSLLALEALLGQLAGDVDAGNCAERLAARGGAPTRGGDFFAERQAQLVAALARRCAALRQKTQQTQWAAFAGLFNRQFAGRPPFAAPGWSADAAAVDVEELPALYRAFDAAQRAGGAAGKGAAASRQFVEQLERTRPWLQALLPAEEGAAAGWDVAVEFRAASAQEAEGNKVIEWSMAVGTQQLQWRDAPRALRWEPGQPVSVTLRLAKDGPATPRADERQPALRVSGKSATWSFNDPWALLSLLQRQREPEAVRGEAKSQLLRLELPLLVQGADPAAAPAEGRARVFLRLTLAPAGRKAPLAWPGPFPTRAPDRDGALFAREP